MRQVVVASIVLLISSIVPGVRVKGFGGALVAALVIAGVAWLVSLVLDSTLPA